MLSCPHPDMEKETQFGIYLRIQLYLIKFIARSLLTFRKYWQYGG
jgi:hypothetical protein